MTKLRRRILREATWLLAASLVITLLWAAECLRMVAWPGHALSGWLLSLMLVGMVLYTYPVFLFHRWFKAGVQFQLRPSDARLIPRWARGLHMIQLLLLLVGWLLLVRGLFDGQWQSMSNEPLFLIMLASSIGFTLDFYHYRRWLLRLP